MSARLVRPASLLNNARKCGEYGRLPKRTLATSVAYEEKRASRVNELYQPGVPQMSLTQPHASTPALTDDQVYIYLSDARWNDRTVSRILKEHADEREWTRDEIESAVAQHALFTWGATDAMSKAALHITKGDGIYFYTADGRKYIDFNSQAMCLSLGHTPPKAVVEAIQQQLVTLPFAYNGVSSVPIRGKLSKLLAEVCPGDINTFMYPSSGAEANEAAIRMARMMTGRPKIFNRYRSYHGGTNATLSATGDQRRWATEPINAPGFIKMFDAYPYSFTWGNDEEMITRNCIAALHEQLKYEGPHTVAAIMVESITGTNGVIRPPRGYLEAVRELCDKYGILLICDEVMAGWGRSGKIFGFCHADGVIPDIVTFAKGVNSAYIPLGGVGVRDHVANHFRKNPLMYGSTYNGHPVALASAYAVIKYMLENKIIDHAAAMQAHMEAGLEMLASRHPSVKQGRVVGLFGAFDICKNHKGDFVAEVTEPLTPAMQKLKAALYENGLFTMLRGHQVFCLPPLIITQNQIRDAFDIFDKCLPLMDDAMED